MKARRWDAQTKAKVVLEGLRGRPVSEICSAYGIHTSMYYEWRDKFLRNMGKVFEMEATPKEAKLKAEVLKLKALVGELTLELKKSEEWL
jgi:transposase-like protein